MVAAPSCYCTRVLCMYCTYKYITGSVITERLHIDVKHDVKKKKKKVQNYMTALCLTGAHKAKAK